MNVRFVSRGARAAAAEAAARRGVAAVLSSERVRARQDLHVVWTTRARVRALNRRFRGVDRFTDVIAFRYEDGRGFEVEGPRRASRLPLPASRLVFGDVFIAVPQARINARRFGVPLREELVRLAVHGALHLLGYTDYAPRERKKMWAKQEAIVRRVLGRR